MREEVKLFFQTKFAHRRGSTAAVLRASRMLWLVRIDVERAEDDEDESTREPGWSVEEHGGVLRWFISLCIEVALLITKQSFPVVFFGCSFLSASKKRDPATSEWESEFRPLSLGLGHVNGWALHLQDPQR